MKQVFLSYARLDAKKAQRLYRDLTAGKRLSVWFDRMDLLPGMRWEPAIRKAIRESRYFIALLSRDAVSRRGFRHTELRQALGVLREFPEDKIFLIPTRLDDCTMPAEILQDLTYADLFPTWKGGLDRLRQALRVALPAPRTRKNTRVRSSAQPRRAPLGGKGKGHPVYRVSLAAMGADNARLRQVADGLNGVQSMFRFSSTTLRVPGKATRVLRGNPQLHLQSIPASFYERLKAFDVDYVLCMTRRLLSFDEKGATYSNYLSSPSPSLPNVWFISTGAAERYAREAGVSTEVAIASRIISQIVSHFLDLDYHEQTRSCPMDFTRSHDDLVGGLRSGRFCRQCASQLARHPDLERVVLAMEKWGRASGKQEPGTSHASQERPVTPARTSPRTSSPSPRSRRRRAPR